MGNETNRCNNVDYEERLCMIETWVKTPGYWLLEQYNSNKHSTHLHANQPTGTRNMSSAPREESGREQPWIGSRVYRWLYFVFVVYSFFASYAAYNNLRMAQCEYDIWFLSSVNYCVLIRRQQLQLYVSRMKLSFGLVGRGTEFLP